MRDANAQLISAQFGDISAKSLTDAINDVRNNPSKLHSKGIPSTFLRTVQATCNVLPHTNEAASDAKKRYFSFLIRHGLPLIFFTISPDDQRAFRISVYAYNKSIGPSDQTPSPENCLQHFKLREQTRLRYPGVCAMEYENVINTVIRYIFRWDEHEKKSVGVGLFGETQAWCLATEEQGRKTLHGHFLIWIKNGNKLLNTLMKRETQSMEYKNALAETKRYSDACSSAQMFADFQTGRTLEFAPPFKHSGCRSKRREKQMRYTIVPVDPTAIQMMRSKKHAKELRGQLGHCEKCKVSFYMNGVIQTALNAGSPTSSQQIVYKGPHRQLEQRVYNHEMDFEWYKEGNEVARCHRYFDISALTNSHSVVHTTRCFKRQPSCYADLPAFPIPETTLLYVNEPVRWSDWKGNIEPRYMFKVQLKRKMEDIYTNTHAPDISQIIPSNNNFASFITGAGHATPTFLRFLFPKLRCYTSMNLSDGRIGKETSNRDTCSKSSSRGKWKTSTRTHTLPTSVKSYPPITTSLLS